jgi:hypothetical protein
VEEGLAGIGALRKTAAGTRRHAAILAGEVTGWKRGVGIGKRFRGLDARLHDCRMERSC